MVAQERSNEELCILAQQGDEQACLQLLKQNRGYIVKQMKNYTKKMIQTQSLRDSTALKKLRKMKPRRNLNNT